MSQTATRYQELEARALQFHRAHPEVWKLFCRFTFELIERGFRHYSAQHGVFSRIRWETDAADARGKNTFKLNNNWSAFYARWFMKAYPEYDGFYRIRSQTSKACPATRKAELGPKDFDSYTRARRPRRPMAPPSRAQARWRAGSGAA